MIVWRDGNTSIGFTVSVTIGQRWMLPNGSTVLIDEGQKGTWFSERKSSCIDGAFGDCVWACTTQYCHPQFHMYGKGVCVISYSCITVSVKRIASSISSTKFRAHRLLFSAPSVQHRRIEHWYSQGGRLAWPSRFKQMYLFISGRFMAALDTGKFSQLSAHFRWSRKKRRMYLTELTTGILGWIIQ